MSGPGTVVLVHGGFVDGSGWQDVHRLLTGDGYSVSIVQNPTLSLEGDAAAAKRVIDAQGAPVVLVGHSYGGAVITNAATGAANVVGLVFVAAFAPDEGETLNEVTASSKDSVLGTVLVPRQYPTASGTGTEFFIDPAKARDAFAGDLTDAQAALIGTIQRPVADLAFGEPTGVPAWKTLPSWAVVATNDRAAGTDVVRAHAQRAGAAITELDGSHVSMISQPQAVTETIQAAIAKLG